jgi:phosphoserine aminotransferase
VAADPDAVRLPADLLPGDGRFGSGPSKVRPDAVSALAAVATTYLGTSHRLEGIRSVVRGIREGMAELFALPAGYEVVLGDGGSMAFFDAAVFSLVERRAKHLVLGEFSRVFAAATGAAPFLEPTVVVDAVAGSAPSHVACDDADTYCYPHNETSTGVMLSVQRPDGDATVVVDATSAAGGLRVDPRQFDVYFFAPQKCFASDGSLWIALCSPAAVERIERVEAGGRFIPRFLSLAVALENSRLDQTFNTPALATLFLLRDSVRWMLEHGGLEFAASRCDRSAEILYGWAESRPFAMPFVAKPDLRSHTVATIDFVDAVDAAWVARALRANGVVDTEPYRKLGRNQLRIALYPAIEPGDVAKLTRAIDYLVDVLG